MEIWKLTANAVGSKGLKKFCGQNEEDGSWIPILHADGRWSKSIIGQGAAMRPLQLGPFSSPGDPLHVPCIAFITHLAELRQSWQGYM